MSDQQTHHDVERPVSLRYLVHVLRAYAPIILVVTAAVAVFYLIIASLLYVVGPSQRVTTVRFRLDFKGATEGQYPNGNKFSGAEIVSTPILLKVFKENQLQRFTNFERFSRALYVLEANPEYERMAVLYQGRLADPRLSPIDRERILHEWELKSTSIAKNEYSINWMRTSDTADVPDNLIRKSLLDVLDAWAHYAIEEQHVLDYSLPILRQDVLDSLDTSAGPVVSTHVLRSRVYQIIEDINQLEMVPGAQLIRSADHMSLEEIRLRLSEIVRFRLEPLTAQLLANGANRAATVRFFQSQLAYDERQLKAVQDSTEALRQSLALYVDRGKVSADTASGMATAAPPALRSGDRAGETVIPQINETFIDRLVALSSQAVDRPYMERAANEYKRTALFAIPFEQAVAYDREVLDVLAKSSGGEQPAPASVNGEIESIRQEARQLLVRTNEIYQAISRNLNPSTQLYSLGEPPITRSERRFHLSGLLVYGVLLSSAAFLATAILSFAHARLREEEAEEEEVEAA